MLISRWIDSLTGQQRMVEDLTQKIAARCESSVRNRIQRYAHQMDPAQARGYIRARAAAVICRESRLATQKLDGISDSILQRVKNAVSDEIVRRLSTQIAVQQPGELRRAA